MPADLNSKLADQFAKLLAKKGVPGPVDGSKTLTVSGRFIYYESAGMGLSQVTGPIEQVVARVQLREGERIIAEANCVGRSTTTLAQGVNDKAAGLAKAIVSWIARHYPKDDST